MLIGDIKMDIKKEPIFRIQIKDIKTKKSKILTVYRNGENPTLEQFKQRLIKSIKEE